MFRDMPPSGDSASRRCSEFCASEVSKLQASLAVSSRSWTAMISTEGLGLGVNGNISMWQECCGIGFVSVVCGVAAVPSTFGPTSIFTSADWGCGSPPMVFAFPPSTFGVGLDSGPSWLPKAGFLGGGDIGLDVLFDAVRLGTGM